MLVQALTDNDKVVRMGFCKWWADAVLDTPELYYFCLWSDESTFHLNGLVNRHNCVYYSTTNPNIQMEVQLKSPGVCVWAGIWGGGVIGPYFFDGNVKGENYIEMIGTFLVPKLRELGLLDIIYFQQDGAPAHFHHEVRQFIAATFPDRVIGRGGDVSWPPRSCDLTPPDFFLWGYIKDEVYKQKCNTLDQLRNRIRIAFAHIPNDLCERVCACVTRRLQKCSQLKGSQVD